MLTTVFHNADLPQTERPARLDDLPLHDDRPPPPLTDAGPAPFRGASRTLDLGPVNIAELTWSPSLVRRTPAMILQTDPELCSVVFPRRGALVVTQAGREALLGERDLALYDGSRPFGMRGTGRGTVTLVRAQVPRALLPLSARHTDRLLGTRLPGREGVGALLTQFLGDLAAGQAPRTAADIDRLSAVTLDLLAATLAHHLDAGPRLPDASRRRTLLLSIEAYVRDHLSDPDLAPRDIAAAHHISVSYLHRLFRSRDTTVTELIRRRRLERAHRALSDPRLRDTPVHRIAADCGFREHSAFTRAFNSAYGMPPRDWRREALRVSRG